MRKFVACVVASAGLVGVGSAQFLLTPQGFNNAEALDSAAYYDAQGNTTYLDGQDVDNTFDINTDASANTAPWSATFANGVASGNGEAATAQGVFSNASLSASLSTFLAVNAQLSSNITGSGPYYGLSAGDFGTAGTHLDFTTSEATTFSYQGTYVGTGSRAQVHFILYDFTQNTQTNILVTGSGSYSLNGSLDLTAGDDYALSISILGQPYITFDPNNSDDFRGADGASLYVTTSFTPTTAPEPAAFIVLGLGSLALLRRRQGR